MKLAEAIGTKIPNTICAIDASTNSLAFAIFDTQQKTLGVVGKITFKGKDICLLLMFIITCGIKTYVSFVQLLSK